MEKTIDKNLRLEREYERREPESQNLGSRETKGSDTDEIKRTKDSVLMLLLWVVGFLYWNLISIGNLGAGVSIFTLVLCGISVWYFHLDNVLRPKENLIYLALLLVCGLQFFIFDNEFVKTIGFLFLTLLFVYWVAVVNGKRLEPKLSITILGDGLNQLLVIPFHNFGKGFVEIRSRFKSGEKGNRLLHGLVGILVTLPLLILIASLLAQADAAFEQLLQRFQWSLSEDVMETILQVLLGIPVALYLFGLFYGNRHGMHTDHISRDSYYKWGATLGFAPNTAIYSGLAILNGLYLVYFLSQTSYFFSAFGNTLPETMTYSEYARRGFFELCVVAALNLAIIGLAHILIQKKNSDDKTRKVLPGETLSLCVFTLLLIATALSKMMLYIQYYGLTQLRVYTTWFMVMLAVLFVLIGVRQVRRFNGWKWAVVTLAVSILVLCFANIDGIIAKKNIEWYQEGRLASLDVESLGKLSDGATPHLFDLYQSTSDGKLKHQLELAIRKESEGDFPVPEESDFRHFNLQEKKAEQIRAQLLASREEDE